MTDEFAVVDRDEDGNPTISHWLDPNEVSVVPGADGPVAYVWEPHKQQDPGWRHDPLLIECSCRHCRKGRMCRDMADLFRRCARADGDMIRRLREAR